MKKLLREDGCVIGVEIGVRDKPEILRANRGVVLACGDYANSHTLITEHKGECHPQIIIKDSSGTSLAVYAIPEKAYVEVEQNQEVTPGTLLARSPRAMDKVQDITGGLPRVTEIFEVRKPKNPSVIAKIDGVVRLEEEKKRGKFVISVTNEESGRDPEPHIIPPGKHFRVHTGDEVKAGDPLVDGG